LLFDFIDSTISLSDIDKDHTSVLDTPYIFNIETIEDNSLRLLINVHKLNDIRWFNRYFLQTHKKLINGAYFVGRAETIVTNRIRLFKKYPHYFAEVIYVFHFIIKRILPKLPWIKEIYFFITKGKNRSISRAQVLGRLHFCGFRIVAEKETDDGLYYVAQKSKTPSLDKSPSYGPLIKLERSGYQGRTIQIHKFRTMHPYAEYLQEYVYNLNKLRIGGKIKNDFRLTGWGKFMRRFWLDEIPMLINWLKGEVKFFGVRPLSLQYLELYDSDLRELRNKVKPGLIPPFYSDLPKNIDEIRLSERRYIQAYLNSPIKTQWIYFWKAVSNIFFKGARSN
jgi:hypothetical protein